MTRYIIRRLYLYVMTIVLLLFILFWMSYQFPVSRLTGLTGILSPTVDQVLYYSELYQLDAHSFWQFISYLSQRLNGFFGVSIFSQSPILQELQQLAPASLELILCAILIAFSVGVPLGIWGALSSHQPIKGTVQLISLVGFSVPLFWIGIVLSLLVGDAFNLAPTAGRIHLAYEIPRVTGFLLIDSLWVTDRYGMDAFYNACAHLLLPAITLSIYPMTFIVRTSYTALTGVMQSNYIRAAESRGLTTWLILKRHALLNASLPFVRQMSVMFSSFVSYAVINEIIFGWPGVGSWLILGIFHRDYTVIQAGIFMMSFLIITVNLLIDALYVTLSPVSRKDIYDSY